MTEKTRAIAEGYNELSRTYDHTRFGAGSVLPRRLVDDVAKELLPLYLKRGPVLEIGVGTGRYASFLAEQKYRFVGVDISRGMLNIARDNTRGSNPQPMLMLADGLHLPFKEASYVNVVCILTFGFLQNPCGVLKEASKVLQARGRLLIIYHHRETRSKYLHRPTKQKYGAYDFLTIYTKEEIQMMFEAAGFRLVFTKHIVNLPKYCYYHLPLWVYWKLLKPVDDLLHSGWFAFAVGVKE